MSGLFTPIESMPPWAQAITHFNPVKYFVELMRLVLLKGSGWANVQRHFYYRADGCRGQWICRVELSQNGGLKKPARLCTLAAKMHTPMRALLLLLFALGSAMPLLAQQFHGGIRAGLTFNNKLGPRETDPSGAEAENIRYNTGFHVGPTFSYEFNSYFALRAELLFSQKGYRYDYDGRSYLVLLFESGEAFITQGNRNMTLEVDLNYLQLPILAVGRFGPLEVLGGVNFNYLVGARAEGQLFYNDQNQLLPELEIGQEHRYFSDAHERVGKGEDIPFLLGGATVLVPERMGAYYENPRPDEDLYRRFEASLVGGLGFYLGTGLYLTGRVQYGLNDITNDAQDFRRSELDDQLQVILADDFDRNLTFELSVGFRI